MSKVKIKGTIASNIEQFHKILSLCRIRVNIREAHGG